MLVLALLAATAGLVPPSESWSWKPKPPEPRKFTDARIAAAQAKRERKAAKRAKAVRHD